MKHRLFIPIVVFAASMAIAGCNALLPGGTPTATEGTEEATETSDEGGPSVITGTLTYTNLFFTLGVAQPVIILEDQGGFVTRDRDFVIPIESQVIGQLTSDFYTSPVDYTLTLPLVPQGTLHHVDHTDNGDGVMVFAVAYWTNTWGDPFLEIRDQGGGGWSGAYASTKVVTDSRENYLEIYGGKYVVYAPDGGQGFPSGFGDDGLLFTDDDPIAPIPQGWTVVNLDDEPFSYDRTSNPTVELLEPESGKLDDFSGMSYTEAFDAMIEKFRKEYAYTELKKIDWDAKVKEFRPRFEEAEKDNDAHAYGLALRDFIWSIPDGHQAPDIEGLGLLEDFQTGTAGGLGFAIRELDDGRSIVIFVLEDSPAAKAGMVFGTEITKINGQPIADVIGAARPWSLPFSSAHNLRLQQMRYALRFLDGEEVEVSFKNPGGGEQTVKMTAIAERDSFSFTSFASGLTGTELPVEWKMIDDKTALVKIYSFADNDVLTIQIWERMMQFLVENEVPRLVIDMRQNGGGNGFLADQMAAYFFDEELVLGKTGFYDEKSGEFFFDPGDSQQFFLPREELRFHGDIAVLVAPSCYSACEGFTYDMTVQDRAMIVGYYPTGGLAASQEIFLMPGPDGPVRQQMSIGRQVGPDGEYIIEGTGIPPTVRVPVTEETMRAQFVDGQDVVLQAAVDALGKPRGAGVTPSGDPTITKGFDLIEAFQNGAKQLEDLANESYTPEESSRAGQTYLYTIPLNQSRDLMWINGWCTKTQAQFDDNWRKITLEFSLNGKPVALDQFSKFEGKAGEQICRLYYVKLGDWPAGEHVLTVTVNFSAPLNDGSFDYPAGTHVYEYHVYVRP